MELERKFPKMIKLYGFGPEETSLKEFKEKKFFPYPIFIPKIGRKFYRKFDIKNPGFLKCFGFCNKNLLKNYDKAKNLGYNFKGKFSQMGGTFIVNNKGKVLFNYIEKYLGDHCPSQEINSAFDKTLSKFLIQKVENKDKDEVNELNGLNLYE